MKFKKIKLGKKEETIGIGNSLFIKSFENGVKIRKRGQTEITLDVREVSEILFFLRKIGKKLNLPIYLNIVDLTYVWQKYPETQKFVERLLLDEVDYEEKMKIHKTYMTKHNIVEELENDN